MIGKGPVCARGHVSHRFRIVSVITAILFAFGQLLRLAFFGSGLQLHVFSVPLPAPDDSGTGGQDGGLALQNSPSMSYGANARSVTHGNDLTPSYIPMLNAVDVRICRIRQCRL